METLLFHSMLTVRGLFFCCFFLQFSVPDYLSSLILTESVHCDILDQAEVVLGQGRDEDDGGHVLEAVNPLPPLRSLASDIHQPEVDLAKLEQRLLM